MNLKTFAQQARTILMGGVAKKISYWGFDAQGHPTEEPQWVEGGYYFRGEAYDNAGAKPRYQKLREAIRKRGVREVTEEAAYTWFNRMVALKIVSANGYELPTLDYADGNQHLPQLLQRARRGEYTTYLTANEQGRIQRVLHDYAMDTAAFGILLTGYCHAHPLIQRVFGGIDDYTELLLPDDILDSNGFLHLLNTTDALTEADYQRVELIGWLYQFYISERKDEVFASFKKNQKAEAKDIPAATQIFTPNWIVKYMVQNTVGKLWLDHRPDSPLRQKMNYLVPSNESASPLPNRGGAGGGVRLLDPAAGSGHILVEGFDLLYDIYEEEYYSPQEAVEHILRHNLFGLDIDNRAAQLARFAVLLKAAKRYPAVLKSGLLPQIYAMPAPRPFSRQEVLDFLGDQGYPYENELSTALDLMQDAQNLGSVMQFSLSPDTRRHVAARWQQLENQAFRSFTDETLLQSLRPYLEVLMLLTQTYEAIAANPPYMGQKNMNNRLKEYVNARYPLSKSDLFAVFMEACLQLNTPNGLMGMINQQSWMFLSSYEALRVELLEKHHIKSMLHLGPRTFEELNGEVVQSTAFVLQKGNELQTSLFQPLEEKQTKDDHRTGTYYRLVDYQNNQEKESHFLTQQYHYTRIPQYNFRKMPGSPIAYWATNKMVEIFESFKAMSTVAEPRQGLTTSDNDRFLRLWFEVKKGAIGFNIIDSQSSIETKLKWFPHNKGGSIRKWFGNNEHIVNWLNNGFEIKSLSPKSVIRNPSYYFKSGMTWSAISSGIFAGRYCNNGFIFDSKGPVLFSRKEENLLYIIGLLNSTVSNTFLKILAPTLDFSQGPISKLPYTESEKIQEKTEIVKYCISLSRKDWDSRETSWDFQTTPLGEKGANLPEAYQQWQQEVSRDFFQLHANEEELNRIFIELYGLQEELTPEVALKDITILQEELDTNALVALEPVFRERGAVELPIKREVVMHQLISYAIGCLMGRYRLDKPGLHIAHPDPTEAELAPYAFNGQTVEIDADAILPLMGTAADFPDDVLHRFKTFLDVLWGEETRIANLNFLQECLNQDLEKFLVNGFWKVHGSMYKKKPIYWLFASPKGAFQVLVYMHRMNSFTVEKIRSNYLMEHLRNLRFQIEQLSNQTGTLGRDDAKRLDKLRADLLECETYDLHLKIAADAQLSFDLDDGVSVNYEKFKAVVAPIK
jgi:hypothetical protein